MILILLQFGHEFIKTSFTLLYPSLLQRDFQHPINEQNTFLDYKHWLPKALAKFCLSVSQFIFRTKSLTIRKESPEKSINFYHLTIYTHTQAHTCTHIAIASTKDYTSEEKTNSLPHLMKQTQVHCSWGIKILKVTQKVQIKGNTYRYSFVFISSSSSVIKLWPFKNEFICKWEWWVGSWTRVWPFYLTNEKTNATEACRTVLLPRWQSSCPPEIVLITE